MSRKTILEQVEKYYTQRINEHGPTPQGVDWNSQESQEVRFAQLLRAIPADPPFTINDYGCGYGALLTYLNSRQSKVQYAGFEISEKMIVEARKLHPGATFVNSEGTLPIADHTVASGIFNVRLDTPDDQWREYVCEELHSIRRHSQKGFAFNILTSYSDRDRQRADLYYADPLFFFDYCKRNFSRHVALFHDYPLYEFTVAVRL